MVKEAIKKANVLIEALPYIQRFYRKYFIIKYGGSILGEEKVRKSVLENIAFLRYTGIRPILVHGGGPHITERLKAHKVVSEFVDGVRVTDEFTLKIVEEELDKLNDLIVEEINAFGGMAKGFKRADKLIKAVKKEGERDLGFVGDIVGFDREKLEAAMQTSIPIIVPIGISDKGVVFNINADEVASFIAGRMRAEKLVLLTRVLGVMRNPQDNESLIPTITVKEVENLIKAKTVDGGMVPKVRAAVNAIEAGTAKAHIVDAKIPHALLLEIFTDEGIGTEIIK